YYEQFIKENKLEDAIGEMMNDQKFVHDPAYRRQRLSEMRERIKAGKVSDALREAVLKKVHAEYEGKGLFVRSSSNVEDLPNISAKRGLGIQVVEGKKVAEQIIYMPRANSVKVLTRSDEDSLLTFDEHGGVKEVPISGDRAVLTDDVVRRLAQAASLIKGIFG